MSTIPVICDRCRSTGPSGAGDFSHLGDLLDFEPVPRRPRVNGWDAEAQRAFIAALSATGSKRRAALSIGRNAFGVDQLLKAEGADSFRSAYERALAIARQNGSIRLAQGVADAAARNAQLAPPSRLRGAEPASEPGPADEPEMSDEARLELIEGVCRKYLAKVRAEREARLSGEVVAADFYLRQLTFIEVGLDLAASDLGVSAFDLLRSLRRDGHGWLHVAETPFSKALGEQRRQMWSAAQEPERPEHPPRRFLENHGDYSLEPSRAAYGATTTPAAGFTAEQWAAMPYQEQVRARQAEYAAEAAAQLEWEERARAEFEERVARN